MDLAVHMPVLINDIRLNELRFATAALIADKPSTIALIPTRSTPTQTPSGGHDYFNTTPPAARAPQTFRLDLPGRGGARRSAEGGGKALAFDFCLLGTFDAIMAIGDTWDDMAPDGSSIHYHIDTVDPNNGYEVIGCGSVFATEPQHG